MEREFVPYEQALELKELGFNEKCLGAYNSSESLDYGKVFHNQDGYCFDKAFKIAALAPLYQQAFRWFREKHNSDSIIQPTYSSQYQYRMFRTEGKTKFQIYGDYMGKEFKNYEEAELACLKKLIKIVKNR